MLGVLTPATFGQAVRASLLDDVRAVVSRMDGQRQLRLLHRFHEHVRRCDELGTGSKKAPLVGRALVCVGSVRYRGGEFRTVQLAANLYA